MSWLGGANAVQAERYSRDGLYQVDRIDLANGLKVLLKPTDGAHNVSIRLVVGIGMDHYSCEDRELPHLLEHMMFSGTSQYSETELEDLVSSWGASWNAYTDTEQTEYHFDLYSGYQNEAVSLLYQMMTDTRFTEDRVANSRDVVHRESGHDDSAVYNWLFEMGLFHSAASKFMYDMEALCPVLDTANHLDRQRLVDERDKHYVPANMTLIVVGDIDNDLLTTIEQTFGQMIAKPVQVPPLTPYLTPARAKYDGTLSSLFGSESEVGVVYLTENLYSPDLYALTILDRYVDNELYARLRTREGITYTPGTSSLKDSRGGWLWGYADVSPDDENLALEIIEQIFAELKVQGIDQETLQSLIRTDLLEYSISYETNSSLADLYTASLFELQGDRFLDMEAATESLTVEQMNEVIQRNLGGTGYRIVESPLMSFGAFITSIVALLLVAALALWRWWLRRRSR
ncbi:insulinase family protein [Aestuariirhabdus sp. Z084]|uniref:M16 family metallopeptidase n=1 Tax=Aestuariirhabdus haliotis TaxID=2918751 RepID=UPI00201B3D92|nr:pitrilysin family protein [Aestuariirhabdus haliotis]MCL6415524.1 insulinase family protein [Aestuariirhabdus haliotis]MCL6419271.1 insulinase family protein [Aestuariirhabdus haliotis]